MLSIIIPCFNEKYTIEEILNKVLEIDVNKEIIIVDDGSTDGTREIIKEKFSGSIKKIFFKDYNSGKGSAIIFGLNYIEGDYVAIQDADLEYNPKDLAKMFKYAISKKIPVLYGSRVLNKNRYLQNNDFTSIYRVFFNHVLTLIFACLRE